MATKIEDRISLMSDDGLMDMYRLGLEKWLKENKTGQYTVIHLILNELVSRGHDRCALIKIRTDMTTDLLNAA